MARAEAVAVVAPLLVEDRCDDLASLGLGRRPPRVGGCDHHAGEDDHDGREQDFPEHDGTIIGRTCKPA